MDEIDLCRAAAAMIQTPGANAAVEAAMRSDELLDQGAVEGSRVWRKIAGIINQLEAVKPDGAALH